MLKSGARTGVFSLVFSFLMASPWIATATHERDHRYEVRGYLLDEQRQPRSGVTVFVSKDNRSLGQAVTDGRGSFNILAHLHDSDIGRRLVVRAGNSVGEIQMQATRGDTSTRRVHHVSFIGAQLVEEKISTRTPSWLYFAGGVTVAVLAVAGFAVRGRKKKQKATAEQNPESKKRKKRNKNKKKQRKN